MKTKICVSFLLFLVNYNVLQAQTVLFNNTYGSSAAEAAFSSVLSKDGDYYTVGWTENTSNGNSDILVIKTNKDGTKVWEKTYGLSDKESGISILELSNGDLIIGGSGRSFGTGLSDCLLVRINDKGEEIWSKSYGTTVEDYLRKVVELPNKDLLLCGYTQAGNGGTNLLAIQLDEDGNIIWSDALGGDSDEEGWTVAYDKMGNSYFGGWSKSTSNNNSDFFLVKKDVEGETIFEKKFGGSNVDSGLSLLVEDNHILFAGSTLSYGNGKSDLLLYRLDLEGNIISSETFGSTSDDYCRSICKTNNGFCLVGYTTGFNSNANDVLIVLANENGYFGEHFVINEPKDQDAWGVINTNDNTVLITARGINPNRSDYDVKLIKYRIGVSETTQESIFNMGLAPNPANQLIQISNFKPDAKYEIFGQTGKRFNINTISQSGIIDISELESGLYFLKVNSNRNVDVLKFIKI
ncbi:MAG: T9SS type A sorting domain-containing protein [Saprospiraceae bacterium]